MFTLGRIEMGEHLRNYDDGVNVLVSDSQPVIRTGVKNIIESDLGIEVENTLECAELILEYCQKKNPRLIIIDCFLIKEGPDFIRKIKEVSPETNILVLTLEDDPIDVCMAMNYGASGYVLKTASMDSLKDAILRTFNGETYLAKNMVMHLVETVSSTEKSGNSFGLSKRELQVLTEISKGKTNKEIAYSLQISIRTVETHRYNIRGKTSAYTNAKLIKIAKQLGLA